MKQAKIAVLGAGNTGCALAGYLGLKGYPVNLYADKNHIRNLEAIIKNSGIKLRGRLYGFAKITKATTDLKEAISGVKYIFITFPSFVTDHLCTQLFPHVSQDQIIVFMPGNFSALYFLNQILQKNLPKLNLLEMATSPFACRISEPGQVNILAIKKNLLIGSYPANAINDLIANLKPYIPGNLIPCVNVLESSLTLVNGVIHPTTAILNTGWIEVTKGNFYFYREGMSDSIMKVLEQLDNERISICRELGVKQNTCVEILSETHSLKFENIQHFARTSTFSLVKSCPENLQERYVSEDVPYILVPWYCLGSLIGVQMKALAGVIHFASIINQEDYLETGRNLRRLGLEDMSKKEILDYVYSTY